MIKRIHVTYYLAVPSDARPVVDRVHDLHAKFCPVYRSLYKGIDITTEYRIEPVRTDL